MCSYQLRSCSVVIWEKEYTNMSERCGECIMKVLGIVVAISMIVGIVGAFITAPVSWRLAHPLTERLVAAVVEQHEIWPPKTDGKYDPDCVTVVTLAPGVKGVESAFGFCKQVYKQGYLVPICHTVKDLKDFVITDWDQSQGARVPKCGRNLQGEVGQGIVGLIMFSWGVLAIAVPCCIIVCVDLKDRYRRVADSDNAGIIELYHK